MTVKQLTTVLERLEDYLPKWKGLERAAISMPNWFDASDDTKCGSVGCVGGWAEKIYKRDPHHFFMTESLAHHFDRRENSTALDAVEGLFAGKENNKVSDYVEGKRRIVGMINIVKHAIALRKKEAR